MRRIDEIRQKRQNLHIMGRLREGREIETQKDVQEVQRNMSLIRSPAAGLRERNKQESMVEEIHESDEEMDIDEKINRSLKLKEKPKETSMLEETQDVQEENLKKLIKIRN